MIRPFLVAVLAICAAWLASAYPPAAAPHTHALSAVQAAQSSVLARHDTYVLRGLGSRLEVYRLEGVTLREVGALDGVPGLIQDIASHGEHVFLGLRSAEREDRGGVAIVDLGDPTRPRLVDMAELGPIRAVGVSDAGLLYAAGPGAEDPYRAGLPGIVRTLRPTGTAFDVVHEMHIFDNLADLSLQGDRLFVLEERLASMSGMTTVRTVDIADPTSPRKTSVQLVHGSATALEITGGELLAATGEKGLHRLLIEPEARLEHGARQRWDPHGCVSATASRNDVTAVLNPCAGSVTFVTRAPRITPFHTVDGLGAVSDALWWDDRLIVAGASGEDPVVLHMEVDGWDTDHAAPPQAPRPHLLAAQLQAPRRRLFLPIALAATAPAQATRLLRRASLAGPIRAIATTEERIYAGEGQDLVVLSAVDDGMRLLDRRPNLGGDLFDLEVRGNRLYAAAGQAGLLVWELDTEGMPTTGGRISTGDWAMDVEVHDDVAFVAALDAGVQSFDVTGTRPRALQSVPLAQRALRILRRDEALYVGSPVWWERTAIIDASDARNVRLAGHLPDGGWDETGDARLLLGDRLFTLSYNASLEIFDVSRPLAPRHLSTWEAESDLRTDGVYLTTLTDESRAQAWLGSELGVTILDLADPAAPRMPLHGEGTLQVGAFARQGGHVLAARDVVRTPLVDSDTDPWGTDLVSDGIAAIDADACCDEIRTYRSPLSRVQLFPAGDAGPPRYATRYVVPERAAGRQRIERETFVLDLSDPARPSLGEPVVTPLDPSLQIIGKRGYQLHRADPEADLELQVLSLDDPARPRVLARLATTTYASFHLLGPEQGILVRHEGALNTSTLQWLDLGDDGQLRLLGELTVDGGVGAVHTNGDRTWFVRHEHRSPSRIQVLSRSPGEGVRIVQDRALPAGVWTAYDIVDPVGDAERLYFATSSGLYATELAPSGALLDFEPLSGRVLHDLIAIGGNRWLGIGDGTVLLDTRDPRRPFVLDELDPSGRPMSREAYHAALHGSWIYLETGWGRSGDPAYTEVVELR